MEKQAVVKLLKKTIKAIEQDEHYQGTIRYYLDDDNEYNVSVTLPDMLELISQNVDFDTGYKH